MRVINVYALVAPFPGEALPMKVINVSHFCRLFRGGMAIKRP